VVTAINTGPMTAVIVCVCLQAEVSSIIEIAADNVQFPVEVTGGHMRSRKELTW